MSTMVRKRRLWTPSRSSSFSPYSSAYPQPLEALWAGDPLAIQRTNGQAVPSWRNGGSRGSGVFLNNTGAQQPTYRTCGIGLRPALLFDGADDRLFLDIADIANPYKVLIVCDSPTATASTGPFGNGSATATSEGFGISNIGNWFIRGGGSSALVAGVASRGVHVITALFNGVSSNLRVDGNSVATGTGGLGSLKSMTIGAMTDLSGNPVLFWPGKVAFVGVYSATDNTDQLEADLIAHYSFNPLTQVPGLYAGGWGDDPAWARPADGAAVASWRNPGSVTGDPAQATGADQPLMRYAYSGLNNRGAIEFDGASDYLRFDIANIPQPFKVLAVAKTDTLALGQRILGRGAGGTNRGFGVSSGNQYTYNWNTAQVSGGIVDTNGHVYRHLADSTNSLLWIDGVQRVSGDASTGDLSELIVGAGYSAGPANFWDGGIGFYGIWPITAPDSDLVALQDDLRTYFATA